MFNPDTEILFPTRVIPQLRSMHGEGWHALIDRLRSGEAAPAEVYAFVLMMVRMCGCVGCNADSFRAMRGCSQCARQTVKRLRGTDREIVEQFRTVQNEVEQHMQKSGDHLPRAGK
jgi:hypothetical protein